ncbi:MAG TPA: hypothetical protein VJI32_06155, partial [Candidatus Nanoarchaeia archaeon]|nr:hypothetical protein [Candidatus Nanoarchaeia archaeon]
MHSLTRNQKGLLAALYGLLLLMVIFSIMSIRNLGDDGYGHCLEKRCATVGLENCQKLREVSSCCFGAGGKVAISDNNYICTFE